MSVIEEIKAAEAAAVQTIEDAKIEGARLVAEAQTAQKSTLDATKKQLQDIEVASLQSHQVVINDKQQKIAAEAADTVAAFETTVKAAAGAHKDLIKKTFLSSN